MTRKILFAALLCICRQTSAQEKINVSAYGATPDNFKDAVPALQRAIAACKGKPGAVLVFEKGRYDLYPDSAVKKEFFISNTSSETEVPVKTKTIGLYFEGLNGLTIEGNGAELVFHGKMTTWVMDRCENITMRNISVDFERPSMSEMTIREIKPDRIVAAVHPDSRFAIINDKLEWYGDKWGMKIFHAVLADTAKGVYTYSSWTPFLKSKATLLSPGVVQFTGNFSGFKAKPGDIFTVRDGIRDQVGAFVHHCKNVRLEDLQMRYMHGLGIVSQFSENLSYHRIQVKPAPGSGRAVAAFADGMHFSGCKGHIEITDCWFKGLHDDPVNVHGTHLVVTEKISQRTLRLRFMHPQTYGFPAFFAEDSVMFLRTAMLQGYGTGKVTAAKMISERDMEITLDKNVPEELKTGDCLENITWTPSLTVRNCRFESVNTRGLLVTTRKPVLIENNTFYRTGMHAILIADDASSWYESGNVQNVTIRNNTFEGCGYNLGLNDFVIAIHPENHQLVPKFTVHSNIRIERNRFILYDYPVLTARSTKNLSFIQNTIRLTDNFLPSGPPRPAFALEACENVKISGNTIDFPSKPVVVIKEMIKKELRTDLGVVPMKQ